MKISQETRKKISDTMKRKGIKPLLLPSREQCIKNLKNGTRDVWNKDKKGLQVAWNKGKKYEAILGSKNPKWKGGLPKCSDCKKELKNRKAKHCVQCSAKFRKGEQHYAWKGGAGQPFRRGGEYKQWRMSVYRRDFFTCKMEGCGYKGKNIEAHHIIPCRNDKNLIFDINNGITLCKDCHNKTRNREEFYQKQFQDIIKQIEFRLP